MFVDFQGVRERVLNSTFQTDKLVNDLDQNNVKGDKEGTAIYSRKLTCNKEALINYGLVGKDISDMEQHPYCPNIQENCCSLDDAIRSKYLWNNQSKFLMERYYQTYLVTMKYLLGYSAEGYLLARDQEVKSDRECKNAAVDLISMNLNAQTTEMIYKSLKKSLTHMSEIRKGFYCILCDAVQQKELNDFWVSTNEQFSDRIYYSKDFCSELVDKSIQAVFYNMKYVRRYLKDVVKLMNCSANIEIKLDYQVDLVVK